MMAMLKCFNVGVFNDELVSNLIKECLEENKKDIIRRDSKRSRRRFSSNSKNSKNSKISKNSSPKLFKLMSQKEDNINHISLGLPGLPQPVTHASGVPNSLLDIDRKSSRHASVENRDSKHDFKINLKS
jgi:hypothetical protein